MEFKAARCPNCSGELQLPDNLEIVKCMYCQSDIIIKDAIKLKASEINYDNILKLAETALNSGNNSEAYTYFNKILEFDIQNYKAWYGKAVSAGWQSSLGNMRLIESIDLFKNAIANTPENEKDLIKVKSATELNNICIALYNLAVQNFTILITLDSYNQFIERLKLITVALEYAVFWDPKSKNILNNIVIVTKSYMGRYTNNSTNEVVFLSEEGYKSAKAKLEQTEKELKRLDPNTSVTIPEQEKAGNCYIATAVYGSYDSPEVIILRKFRDRYLLTNSLGTIITEIYYFLSPKFVKYFSQYILLKKLALLILNKLTFHLRKVI